MGSFDKIEKYILHFPQKNAQGRAEVEKRKSFLDVLVTGDEKWVVSVNRSKRKVPQIRPFPQDIRGLVHNELLPAGQTVDADRYCRQLTTGMEKVCQLS